MIRRRRRNEIGVVLALAAASSCHSNVPNLNPACALNSDCDSPLVCVFSLCHNQCVQSRDCPDGERCVSSGQYNVCLLPKESSCADDVPCEGVLICAPDEQCRDSCQNAEQCTAVKDQTCTSNVCIDVIESDMGVTDASEAMTSADSQADASAPSVVATAQNHPIGVAVDDTNLY
jgi:hypothetical protein